jgi:hypothetical protein
MIKIRTFVSACRRWYLDAVNGEEICTESTAVGEDFLGFYVKNGKPRISLKIGNVTLKYVHRFNLR